MGKGALESYFGRRAGLHYLESPERKRFEGVMQQSPERVWKFHIKPTNCLVWRGGEGNRAKQGKFKKRGGVMSNNDVRQLKNGGVERNRRGARKEE